MLDSVERDANAFRYDCGEKPNSEGYIRPIERGRTGLAEDLRGHLARYEGILKSYAQRYRRNEDSWTGSVSPEGHVTVPIPVGG